MSPTLLGIPSEHVRKYCCFTLASFVTPNFQVPFDAFFFRNLVCDGSVYLGIASAELRDMEKREMAASCRQVHNDDAMDWGGDVGALGIGSCARLEGWRLRAHKMGLCSLDGVWSAPKPPMALVNVTQTDGFAKVIKHDVFPALHALCFP